MTGRVFGAVDVGASSGRVVAGVFTPGQVTMHAVHRFPNATVDRGGHLHWDMAGLYRQVLEGIALLAARYPMVESLGIDTWGVDYGLLDAHGELLAEPTAYRDERTTSLIERLHRRISPDEMFRINGLQFLPFNTIYQIEAEKGSQRWATTAHLALLPDLIAYWLTGSLRTEATNASTTGLVDVSTGTWSDELLRRMDMPPDRLPAIESAGAIRGEVRPQLCRDLGLRAGTVVTTVGSHDTASAVVGIPAETRSFAYVVSGTWSLVGVEVDDPVVTDASRLAGFSNELGVDGRIRFLRNAGGLWLLQESMRSWAESGEPGDLVGLLAEAAMLPAGGPVIDVGSVDFIAPGEMPDRIRSAVCAQGEPAPQTRAQLVRCVVDSLARAYGSSIERAAQLAQWKVDVVHIVGGGSQNSLLCQLTADSTKRPVVAGPVEATALGNLLVQARTHGAVAGSLDTLRMCGATAEVGQRYEPGQWKESA
jgi:rhamnulokinase